VSFKDKIVHNILWVSVSNILLKFINFFIIVILARLLEPADFGLVAIAFVIVNFFEIARDLGIGTALIHRKENNEIAADTAFFLFPIIAAVFYIVSYLIAPIASDFFKDEKLILIIRVLSLTFIIWSFGNLPRTLLSKGLNFKKMVVSDVLSKIGYGTVAIIMAYKGFGVWSLVGGRLFLEIVALITIWTVLDWRPSFRFNVKIALELLHYGKHVIIASIIVFFVSVIDTVVVGHSLGPESLGYYNIAFNLSVMITVQNSMMLSKVLLPAYSIIQEDLEHMGKAYIKTLRYLSMIIFPAAFGMISIAWYFVKIFYGTKWLPAVIVLQVLLFGELCTAIQNTTENVYLAAGKPRIPVVVNLLKLTAISILIYPLTLRYGILGTAISISVPSVLILFITFNEAGKIIGKDYLSILKTFQSAAIGSLIMVLLILVIQQFISFLPSVVILVTSICVGIVVYLIFLQFTHEKELEDIKRLLVKMKSRFFSI
jgi:O-antigen/teichoic acid export membrane protein